MLQLPPCDRKAAGEEILRLAPELQRRAAARRFALQDVLFTPTAGDLALDNPKRAPAVRCVACGSVAVFVFLRWYERGFIGSTLHVKGCEDYLTVPSNLYASADIFIS